MAQQVNKGTNSQTENLSLIPGTYMLEAKKWLSQVASDHTQGLQISLKNKQKRTGGKEELLATE